jgi:hypothetical protein
MNRATLIVVCFYLLASPARGQEIAAVDLTHATEPIKSAGKQSASASPKGCEKLLPGIIGDGYVLPPDDGPREIVVEMIKVNSDSPSVGSSVQGEVRLRNIGENSVQIPWSTDPNVTSQGQNPDNLSWEFGDLSIVLQGTGRLKNLSQSLYGSKYVAGSMLAIKPGQWVTFEITFKLEPEYPIPGRIVNVGQGQLRVEWEQTQTTWAVHDCSVARGFFRYGRYYQQQNPAMLIKIN